MKVKTIFYLLLILILNACQLDPLPTELYLNYSEKYYFNDLYLENNLKYYLPDFKPENEELNFENINESLLDKTKIKQIKYAVKYFVVEKGKEYKYAIMDYEISLAKIKTNRIEYWIPFEAQLNCYNPKKEMVQLIDADYSYSLGNENELGIDVNMSIVIGGKDGFYKRIKQENSMSLSSSKVLIDSYKLQLLCENGNLRIVNINSQEESSDNQKEVKDPFKPDYHIGSKEHSKCFNTSREIMIRHLVDLKK